MSASQFEVKSTEEKHRGCFAVRDIGIHYTYCNLRKSQGGHTKKMFDSGHATKKGGGVKLPEPQRKKKTIFYHKKNAQIRVSNLLTTVYTYLQSINYNFV